jgi:AcrR family transcriptional regulator
MQVRLEQLSKGQKTALRILEAAGRCIAQIGAEKTSITAIAQEAKLKRSLIAYHFPKKDEIFFQVMIHIMMQFGQSFLKKRPQYDDPKQDLRALIEAYMDYFQEYPHYFHCYLHCIYMAAVHDRYKILNTKIIRRIVIRIMTKIKRIVAESELKPGPLDIEDFSKIIYSNLMGTIMSYYTVANYEPYTAYKKRCLDILDDEIDLFQTYLKKGGKKAMPFNL